MILKFEAFLAASQILSWIADPKGGPNSNKKWARCLECIYAPLVSVEYLHQVVLNGSIFSIYVYNTLFWELKNSIYFNLNYFQINLLKL